MFSQTHTVVGFIFVQSEDTVQNVCQVLFIIVGFLCERRGNFI